MRSKVVACIEIVGCSEVVAVNFRENYIAQNTLESRSCTILCFSLIFVKCSFHENPLLPLTWAYKFL